MWDIVEISFDTLESVELFAIANLSLDELELKLFFLMIMKELMLKKKQR